MTFMLVFLAGGLLAGSAELPPELAFLEPLAGNEAGLMDAVRAFDRTQSALGDFEVQFAKQSVRTGNAEKAKDLRTRARGRFLNVRKAYEYAVALYPKNARAKNYYGEVLYDRFNEQDAAIKAWLEAVVLDSKLSAAYNNLGVHYSHASDDYRLALQYYDQALALEPDNPDYLFNVSNMYLVNTPQVAEIRAWPKEKVFTEAMRLSKRATEAQPNDFDLAQDYAVNFFAAENFQVVPDWREAARAWGNARGLTSNPERLFYTWLNEARVWILAQDKEQATACLNKALAIIPDNGVAKTLLERARAMETPNTAKKQGKKPAETPGS